METTLSPTPVRPTMPGLLLRLEGLGLLIGAVLFYAHLRGSGLLFIALLLAPDLAMLGYLRNPQIGAAIYNMAHISAVPLGLVLLGLAAQWQTGVLLGLIWLAHIGMDRVAGYGFKYPTAFKDTHLNRV